MSRVEKTAEGSISAGLKKCVQIPHPWGKFDKTFSSVIIVAIVRVSEGESSGVRIHFFASSCQLGGQVSLMAYLPCYNLGCLDKSAE